MKTCKLYNATVPSDINNVCHIVMDIIMYFQEYLGALQEDCIFEFKVILNELIINAMRHGNKGVESKQVHIAAGISEKGYVFIIIEDQGEGYDYRRLLHKQCCFSDVLDTDVCDMKETGRGIMIVKSLCDCIKYNKKGNKVVVLKKVSKV